MKILEWGAISLLVLAAAIVSFLVYMGVFSSVKIEEKEMGPYTLVYEHFVGPYSQTGTVFSRVYESLKADKITTRDGIGIYYDDPSKVSKDRLRSDCGCLIDSKDMKKVKSLGKKYKLKTIKKSLSMVAEFPIRNSLSYMIGPMKAYPALEAHMKKNGYFSQKNGRSAVPFELYQMGSNRILFVTEIFR
ncbi:MAG: hypothetical protein WC490_05650 [Candidatus Margulisiibacteriota bacterium]